MILIASPDTFAARVVDDLVFLDVASDAFYCVLGDNQHAGGDRFSSLSEDQIAVLIADGMLIDAPAPLILPDTSTCDRRRWRDLPQPARHPKLRVHDVLAFLSAHRATTRLLRGDSLLPALAAGRRLTGTTNVAVESVALAVARFEALAIWLPSRGECVEHALTLMHFLCLSGIATEWVFGVHLFPFRAHCWLASGEQVVGDASHRVLAFTPIMVVGNENA